MIFHVSGGGHSLILGGCRYVIVREWSSFTYHYCNWHPDGLVIVWGGLWNTPTTLQIEAGTPKNGLT